MFHQVALHLLPVQPDTDLRYFIGVFMGSREAKGCRPATLEYYKVTLDQFARLSIAARFASTYPPTAGNVRSFLLHKRRNGCNQVSICTYFRSIRTFLNWLEKEKLIDENPIAMIENPIEPRRSIPRAVKPHILKRLFDTIAGQADAGDFLAIRDRAMFRLCYDCGLRGSELTRLKTTGIDLERQEAAVLDGKGGDDRMVYFGTASKRTLAIWLDVLHPGSEYVFVTSSRMQLKPLTRNGAYQALHRWCDRANIEPFRLHDLRHSYACHALRRGIDISLVQRQLGHSSITTTAIYLHAEDEVRRVTHLRLSPGDGLDDLSPASR